MDQAAVKTIIETIAASALQATKIGETPFLVVPEDYQLHDLEKVLPAPRRAVQAVTVQSLDSLADYVNRFGTGHTAVFCDSTEGKQSITAVIDYHTPATPAWCGHTATWGCKTTIEWNRWMEVDGAWMPQEKFALFMEAQAQDIVAAEIGFEGDKRRTPTAAAMLTIARKLRAERSARWEAGEHKENGDGMLAFTQETKGQVKGRGDLVIPEYFAVSLRVFEGSEPSVTPVRFMYAVGDDGKLSLRVDIPAKQRVRQVAFEDARAALADKIENKQIGIYMGRV